MSDQTPPNSAIFVPSTPAEPAPGSWNISDFYSKAWRVTWKNKILWIFGLAYVMFSSTGFNTGGSSSNRSAHSQQDIEHTRNVLGALTDQTFSQHIVSLFQAVPIWVYAALAIAFLALMVLVVITRVIGQSWASASVVLGAEAGNTNQSISIADISKSAFSKIKPLIWLRVPLWIFVILCIGLVAYFAAVPLAAVGLLVLLSGKLGALPILLLAIPLIICAFAYIIYSICLTFAERAVVLTTSSVKNAVKTSFTMTRKKFWWMTLIGIINAFILGFLTLVPIGIMVALFFGLILAAFTDKSLTVPVIITATIIGLPILAIVFPLINAAGTIFKAGIWNQAFRKTQELL